jgi:hypothetical protein
MADALGHGPIYRLLALSWLNLCTWGLDPLSPQAARAIVRRNHLETPL